MRKGENEAKIEGSTQNDRERMTPTLAPIWPWSAYAFEIKLFNELHKWGSGSRKVVFSSTAGLARPAESYLPSAHNVNGGPSGQRCEQRSSAERGRERAGCARFIPLDTPTPIYIFETLQVIFLATQRSSESNPNQTGISSFHGVAFRARGCGG